MASDAYPLVAGLMAPSAWKGELPAYIIGIVQATAGTVVVHDSQDASGPVVAASGGIGQAVVQQAVACHRGVFVVLTGGATGSLLMEG